MCLFFAGESGGESSQSLVNGGKMIRTENISESEEQRMNKKIFKRAVAMMMAAVLTVGAALPSSNVFASGSDEEKDTKTLSVYDADVRTDLDEDEVVTAGDIVIAAGYGFDIENDMEGIVYEQEKVAVSYYPDQGSFDADKPGDYDTYYKVEPVSGKDAYLVHRTIAVKEITTEQTDNTEAAPTEDTKETADDEEPAPGSEDTEYIDLDTQIVKGLSIQRAPAAMLKAAPATGTKDGKDSMKVGFSGYAKFCGRSMGVKYISESGDYYHHSVYCLDLNKKTTNGSVSKSSSTKKVKPEITYCLVNGVRELNKTCHNSKYSSGHATEDYFITGAAIHVLNGEVKLSYEKPFAYEEELKSKTARQFELNTMLDLENKPLTEENTETMTEDRYHEAGQVAEQEYPYGERKDYR